MIQYEYRMSVHRDSDEPTPGPDWFPVHMTTIWQTNYDFPRESKAVTRVLWQRPIKEEQQDADTDTKSR